MTKDRLVIGLVLARPDGGLDGRGNLCAYDRQKLRDCALLVLDEKTSVEGADRRRQTLAEDSSRSKLVVKSIDMVASAIWGVLNEKLTSGCTK